MSVSDTSTQVSPQLRAEEPEEKLSIEPLEHHMGQSDVEPPLEKVISAAPPEIAADAPDGGLWAWLQVLASFFFFFSPWGLINSFGAFQTYYAQNLGQPPSNISWIGTIQGFLLLFVGILTGPLYDKGMLFELLVGGVFLIVFGMMMTSISTEYYQVFLAQGVCMGLGSALLYIPSLSVVVQWFNKKRPIALGVVATGGSIGALLYSIIFYRLEKQIGFGWATRIMGFIMLATLSLSLALCRRRVRPTGPARALFDLDALRSPAFWALAVGVTFTFLGQYMPFYYMTSWAEDRLGLDSDSAFYLISIMNAGSLFGRLLPGFWAVRLGALNLMMLFLLITAVLEFAWLSVDSYATTIVFSLFYGFFSGAGVSLPPTIIAGVTPSIYVTGTWTGMCFGLSSFGLLAGNPIAGALIKAQNGSYVGAQCFAGAAMMAGFVSLCYLRYLKYKAGVKWNMPV